MIAVGKGGNRLNPYCAAVVADSVLWTAQPWLGPAWGALFCSLYFIPVSLNFCLFSFLLTYFFLSIFSHKAAFYSNLICPVISIIPRHFLSSDVTNQTLLSCCCQHNWSRCRLLGAWQFDGPECLHSVTTVSCVLVPG
jgi:hypothetical protein